MRESIGMTTLLNFIIFFIFLVFAFLAGTLSYYKSYRVNNIIVAAIEKYEGYNDLSKDDIQVGFMNMGYERIEVNCPKKANKNNVKVTLLTPSPNPEGYCLYMYENDTIEEGHGTALATTDRYDTYEVVTYMTFKFPVIQNLVKLKASSKTGRIYYFGE